MKLFSVNYDDSIFLGTYSSLRAAVERAEDVIGPGGNRCLVGITEHILDSGSHGVVMWQYFDVVVREGILASGDWGPFAFSPDKDTLADAFMEQVLAKKFSVAARVAVYRYNKSRGAAEEGTQ